MRFSTDEGQHGFTFQCYIIRFDVSFSMNIVKWSSQGMLRLTAEATNELFQPTISKIIKHIGKAYTLSSDTLEKTNLNTVE